MKVPYWAILVSCALAATLGAQRERRVVEGWDVREKDTIRQTLTFSQPSGSKKVRVDNIHGSINILGYEGSEVELVAQRTIWAESNEKVPTAKQEMPLKLSAKDNTIDVFVDAPYRCENGGIHYRGARYYGYEVRYDIEIKVPRATALWVKTINGGEIRIEKVAGSFDVENINGGIEMKEVAGSGRAYALNGKVKVDLSANPRADSYFGSLNGDVDVAFLPGFSANLLLKTFNGGIYSDFPVTYLPTPAAAAQRENGKFVYKSNRFFGVRVGDGGPEIKFDTFNGNIHILKRER